MAEYKFDISQVYDGQQAVEQIQQANKSNYVYNIIFMDMDMPVLDGLQATQ